MDQLVQAAIEKIGREEPNRRCRWR